MKSHSEADPERRLSIRSHRYFLFAACLVGVLSLAVFFRYFLNSGFNLIAGDLGDARFNMTILEHWRAVVHGQASVRSPNFYWPDRGVLGYSDALFLYAPPYVFARAAGMDTYVAFQTTLILLKAIGFFSMLWLLRSFLRVDRSVALVGSAIFTLSNLYFISMMHAQLVTVALVPLLACLACSAWRAEVQGRRRLGSVFAGSLGILMALVLFTSFYIGWFTILATGIAIVVASVLGVLHVRTRSALREWMRTLTGKTPLLAAAFLGFLIAILPFLVTYLPMLKQTGGRSFQDNLSYSSHPVDLLNVGRSNWLWGHPLKAIMGRLGAGATMTEENQRGWPPLTLALVATGLFVYFRKLRNREGAERLSPQRRFLSGLLSVSFFSGWVLALDVGGRSLWWFVFKFIPGGAAIRVPARFNLVLNVFAVVVLCLILDELKKPGRQMGSLAFAGLSLLLVAEQINTAAVYAIRRDNENVIMRSVDRPPAVCASFFLSNPLKGYRVMDQFNQVDAMLIARRNDLPTLNGYGGWNPRDWTLNTFDSRYLENVRRWAVDKHVTAGLCGLDLQKGSWTPMDFKTVPYLAGSAINFRTGGNAHLYEAEGWATKEDGGSWALGEHSILLLNFPEPPETDLLLTFRAHAFIPPQRPSFEETVRVNGGLVADWSVAGAHIEKQIRIPMSIARSGLLRIDFSNHDPRSPAEFGLSVDNRKLGLAIEDVRIVPVAQEALYALGSTIDFRWGGDAKLYEAEGWAEAEDGGTWALGGRSVLTLHLPAPPTTDLLLTMTAHSFLPPQRPKFQETLLVNNRVVADWSVSSTQLEERVRVPQALIRSGFLKIEFFDHDPRSPADFGVSIDGRKLGLALETLKLEPIFSHSR